MPNRPSSPRVRLGVEALEAREVPSTFGPSRGLNVAAGAIFPGIPIDAGPNFYVMGTGPGTVATVRIWDDQGVLRQQFRPFGNTFRGGVTVAVGDVNADGVDDIICGTGAGTTARVRVFTYADGGLQTLATFTPFGPNYNRGVNVAAGPVLGGSALPEGPHPDQIVVSVAGEGPPRVKVYGIVDGAPTPYRSFLAFSPTYRGGVNIAVANIDTASDLVTPGGTLIPPVPSYSEIIVGMATGRPLVRIYDVQGPTVVPRGSFLAFDPSTERANSGVVIAAGGTTGQRGCQIYVNLIGTSTVRVFDGQTSAILGTFTAYSEAGGRPIPTRILSMTIADMTDGNPRNNQFAGDYYVQDLIIVAGDGPYFQRPFVYVGGTLPAGFNGGSFAP